ncbi:MAG: nitroreductase family protein [Thermoleophilia bacterium]
MGRAQDMDVSEALRSRFTCRAFKPDPPEKDKIREILESASRTPSWANTQPWEIFVAGGEVLEGLRRDCLERFRQGRPGNSDIPRAEHWPSSIVSRIQDLMSERSGAGDSLGYRLQHGGQS